MKKAYGYLLVLSIFIILPACVSRKTQGIPTQPTGLSSPLDGQWKGTGRTLEGKPLVISFAVENGSLGGILYSFPGNDGLSCNGIEYGQIQAPERRPIQSGKLAISLGSDIMFTGNFPGDDTASGELTIHWHDRQPRCNGDYDVQWSAVRQMTTQSAASPGEAMPRTSPIAVLLQILVFGLSNGSVLALNAIGVTIIYSTVRTLNLAHGDIFALSTALVTSMVNVMGISRAWPSTQLVLALFLVLLAVIMMAAFLSMGVEQFGFKPFRGASRLAPLIATLGLSFILFQGALVWRTFQGSWIPGEHRSVPGIPEVPTDGIPSFLPEINLASRLGISGLVIRSSDIFVLLVALVFVTLAGWFLQRTRTGRAIRALAQHQEMARILGVDVDGTIRRAFAVGGAFAGTAAFIFALYYSRPFGAHGAQSGLMAFAAAILGGIGSPLGALLSSFGMGIVSSLSDYYLSAQWTPVLMLGLVVLALAWRPVGLTASGDDAASQFQDSVILSSSAVNNPSKYGLWIILALLGVFPLIVGLTGWGGQVILRTVAVFMLLGLGIVAWIRQRWADIPAERGLPRCCNTYLGAFNSPIGH